jgi:hypothetical protein
MITEDKIIEIYCKIDDFCKELLPVLKKNSLSNQNTRHKPFKLSISEAMTIQILFQMSGYRNFKTYYIDYVEQRLHSYFPDLVSYNRMVEICRYTIVPLAVYLKSKAMGNCTGISFADSTLLRVCDNRRIHSHKVFDGLAERGHCSLGWFYGFKLHLVTNDMGQIIDFIITPGNVDDREPLKIKAFIEKLFGKIYADKGYISKTLFESLFMDGIHLVTKLRKNMKSYNVTPIWDAIMLRKRAIIETINDQLKNIFQIEHSRHRSPTNFLANLFSALIAYNFSDKKPSLKINYVQTPQLCIPF